MLKHLVIAENPFDSEKWEQFENVENVCDFLIDRWEDWPRTARIYKDTVAESNDVTPFDNASIDKLLTFTERLIVVIYPADPGTLFIAILAVAVVAAVALRKPDIPTPALRNVQSQSSNNELSDRTNKARPFGRIPDIYGLVTSTPDLISVPYKIFISHQEVEYCNLCVGRGYYDTFNIRDDKTSLAFISGVYYAIYAPFTSANYGTPQTTNGGTLGHPVYDVVRSSTVNGQTLRAENSAVYTGTNNIYFQSPNLIKVTGFDFTDKFIAGDVIQILGNTGATDLRGTYTSIAVDSSSITLSNPSAVNGNWSSITTTGTSSPTLQSLGPKWVGTFFAEKTDATMIFCNFVAPNGSYKDNGTNQFRQDVVIEIEVTPATSSGTANGTPQTFQVTVEGSATTKTQRAVTLMATPNRQGPYLVRARRVTPSDTSFQGTIVDEVKWRDLYAVNVAAVQHFGNVTTMQCVTYATVGALAVKDRKLNLVVQRKLPIRVSGTTFTPHLVGTSQAEEIITAICLDPYIGRRTIDELDLDSIYGASLAAKLYFGATRSTEFNYTFDNDNLSFEETIQAVANAAFCLAYRQGNKIKLNFEGQTQNSTLLFNHRNKIPDSETRTITFGNQNKYDGVAYKYVDSKDDSLVTLSIPANQTALNPKTIESIGIRYKLQAYFHAWREWNKVRYQNTITEFEATQEANLLVDLDRVLVADNTRSDTQDGEVLAQNGLTLTLSQSVVMQAGVSYTIFLQHVDGTVQAIPITAGPTAKQIVLGYAPSLPLSLDDEAFARATYIISGSNALRGSAFLIQEKEPQNNMTVRVKAFNYDDRYYTNDFDLINGVIDFNGNNI